MVISIIYTENKFTGKKTTLLGKAWQSQVSRESLLAYLKKREKAKYGNMMGKD